MGLRYHSCLGRRVITVSSGQSIPQHCYLTISLDLAEIHDQLLVLCSTMQHTGGTSGTVPGLHLLILLAFSAPPHSLLHSLLHSPTTVPVSNTAPHTAATQHLTLCNTLQFNATPDFAHCQLTLLSALCGDLPRLQRLL